MYASRTQEFVWPIFHSAQPNQEHQREYWQNRVNLFHISASRTS